MRFYKLRVTPNAAEIASTFNSQFKPETIAEYNDPYRVDWTEQTSSEESYIGDKVKRLLQLYFFTLTHPHQALNLADPQKSGYMIKNPIYGNNFNTRDYHSVQMVLSDIELLIQETLKERFDIVPSEYKVGFLNSICQTQLTRLCY
jgi:actin-related protein 8